MLLSATDFFISGILNDQYIKKYSFFLFRTCCVQLVIDCNSRACLLLHIASILGWNFVPPKMGFGAEVFVMAVWDYFIFLYVHLVTMFDMGNGKSSMFLDFLEEKQTNMRLLSFAPKVFDIRHWNS